MSGLMQSIGGFVILWLVGGGLFLRAQQLEFQTRRVLSASEASAPPEYPSSFDGTSLEPMRQRMLASASLQPKAASLPDSLSSPEKRLIPASERLLAPIPSPKK